MQGIIGSAVIAKVKNARVEGFKYKPETEMGESELEDSEIETEEEEVIEYIKNEAVKLENSYRLAEFLNGIKFQMRLDTFEIRLVVPRREIVRYNEVHPNWHLVVKGFCVKMGFVNKD